MEDLFNTPDPVETEETLRVQLTQKWKEKFPAADEELIRVKVDSDLYIKTLERQKDELRTDFMKSQEEIQKGKALEELIDRLNQKDTTPAIIPEAKEKTPPSLAIDDVEKWYEQKVRNETESKNFQIVQAKLQERYGQSTADFLQEQSTALGLTKEEINSLAKKSPQAFFRTMGITEQGKDLFMAPPKSGIRNDQFSPKTVKRDWNFYENMRKTNPSDYKDPKTQLQMHRDAEALGDAFD